MGKKFTDKTGEINYNNFGSKMIITRGNKYMDIDIYFPEYDWTFYHNRYEHFKSGNVKCPYEPRFFNHGYMGEGKYILSKDKCSRTWTDMLRRCYSEKSLEKNQSYKDCTVCDYFLNFQNFAEWYYDNIYFIEEECMQLDKDILVKGNKIYSPSTCIFVPQRINDLFVNKKANRGQYPIGVHKHNTSYITYCTCGNSQRIYLGSFNTPHKAFLMYKINKELIIQSIAEEYKDKIPHQLYEAMMNYQVEEND